MRHFSGKVAVVTGGASGIGRGIAERCAREGMKVVLADIEEDALLMTEKEMRAAGATVLAVRTDVSRLEQVQALSQKTLGAFGAVHLLFNNAGVVGELTNIWRNAIADWEWVLGVNLWGVVHGIHVFVPIMIEQETDCHIVNTSSLSGITAGPGLGVYKVTKHGVFTLSETLFHELNRKSPKIGVSVLCPHWVHTKIVESDRNRPHGMERLPGQGHGASALKNSHAELHKAVVKGISPARVAEIVFDAIRGRRFYIFTHPEYMGLIKMRAEDVLLERNPTDPLSG
jgi:NAD(P)-dependent dehydrogenase (short-subunit alcohol dehydrogenase family)